jgi:hypothetical protein
MSLGVALGGMMIDPVLPQGLQAVIDATIQLEHLGMLLEEGNGGEKERALQAVEIEAVRRGVGGRHQGHAPAEEGAQQAMQQGGVSDVGDHELIQAQHPQVLAAPLRDQFQRVWLARQARHLLMQVAHQVMKMEPLFARQGQGLGEPVHQIGLAPPHAPPEIQARDGRRRGRRLEARPDPARQSSPGRTRDGRLRQGGMQGRKPARGLGLDGVIGGETGLRVDEVGGIHGPGKIAEPPLLGAGTGRELAIFMTWPPRILPPWRG